MNYASVILPLAIEKAYTYTVPEELRAELQIGVRVEVPLKNKLYSGLVVEIHDTYEVEYRLKPIISVLDSEPIITPHQLVFWEWIAHYYCCTIGEVMTAALPSAFRLSSETQIVLKEGVDTHHDLTDDEYLIAEAVSIQNILTIEEIRSILDRKTVYPLIRDLIDKQVITIQEELKQKYKPKLVNYVELHEDYNTSNIDAAYELLSRSTHQTNALLAYIQLARNGSQVPSSAVQELADVSSSVLKAIEKKGVFHCFKKEVTRLSFDEAEGELPALSDEQKEALSKIDECFNENKPALLHGVTGSGKTRVYMELIEKTLAEGRQVLYLLPEIALTTQIVDRVKYIYGEEVAIFHSRLNDQERVEMWKEVLMGKGIVIGARSALFLPFSKLGLIIVDEEHDPSYKQIDPNPRYNTRDAAIILARNVDARIILGTATPSLESYTNAQQDRYGYITMSKRYGDVKLPEFQIIDLQYSKKTGRMKSIFSFGLMEMIESALNKKEQIIIFQNRRGYTPIINCDTCGWKAECRHCDITLTYHKFFDECRCHYCGYRTKRPVECPACGNKVLNEIGFGTEKIENELAELFPEARIGRLDYDSTRSKNAYVSILQDFANRELDILVGTQMVTKGLDYDNISLVGILNADSIFRFPDFRADERAFQIITQVAGRAGRRKKQGQVAVQTYTPSYPLFSEIINYDFEGFVGRILHDRKQFHYPPYIRMIEIEVLHKKHRTNYEAAEYLAKYLQHRYKKRIQGPVEPGVARRKGYYVQQITIKMENKVSVINDVKRYLRDMVAKLKNTPGFKSVRVRINVDPY